LREHILQAGFPRESDVIPFPTLPGNDRTVIVQFRSTVDCLNNTVTAVAPALPTTTNTFAIDAANDQLTCSAQGNTEVLVDGIEDMQVMYGEDFNTNAIASTYVTAANVTDWDNVVSVRIAILAAGQPNSLDVAQPITYNLLGRTVNTDDRTPRRVFTTTIPLRNKNKTIMGS